MLERRLGRLLAASVAAIAIAAVPAAAQNPVLEDPTDAQIEPFTGTPATADPLFSPDPPRHPFMAPNSRSNLHVDAYQTDVHQVPGPLGRDTETRSTFYVADCGSVTFDSRGRIVTICVGFEGPTLRLLDPRTLAEVASMRLPSRQPGGAGPNIFNDFAGGGYFYLDDQDRAVIPTTTRHIYVVKTGAAGFTLERDHDVTAAMASGADKIISALPDWSGRLWFASVEGVVGTIDPQSGAVKTLPTREPISNSFAVDDEGAVWIVTQKALYRLEAGADGTPKVVWREEYANSGIAKPGQVHAGSGTTPTVMGEDLVAITDNSDPMNVAVYRRAREVDGPRLFCSVPVFEKGASATDNSLIATRTSIVVENNYGYSGPSATMDGRVTAPGIERVDVDRDSRTCRKVWHSDEISPTVVPKLSTATGLVYIYTKGTHDDDPWYLTALDFDTGQTVWRRHTGNGLGFNNNYAPVTLGPDGTAYVGVLGGLVLVRDAAPPPDAEPPAPRLRLVVQRLRGDRLRVRVRGARVESVRFRVRRRSRGDERPPFSAKVSPRNRGRRVTARVLMLDGRRVTLRRTLPR